MKLSIHREHFRLHVPFVIARGSRDKADVLSVTLQVDGCQGRGECLPYPRYGETFDSVAAQIESVRAALADGLGREELQSLLPAGAARNAVDCALWDLQAKREGVPVWELAGLREPKPVVTAYTLSLGEPDAMRMAARDNRTRPILKIKLGGGGQQGADKATARGAAAGSADIERLQAVREGAPDSVFIVDANEGWSVADYEALAPSMAALGVIMVEQPLPAGDDEALGQLARSLPVCADEACHDTSSLAALTGKYDFVNIKLDKSGGLTEALALRKAALQQGFRVMVGCMVGSSLAIAPAVLLAQGVELIDLDAPLLLAEDRDPPLRCDNVTLHPAMPALWG